MAADIAIYALDRDPRYFGLHDIGVAPVTSAGRAHLKALFVGGSRIVDDGEIAGLDIAELGREARAAVRALQQAV
jgi:8-oxoguanine deaminase